MCHLSYKPNISFIPSRCGTLTLLHLRPQQNVLTVGSWTTTIRKKIPLISDATKKLLVHKVVDEEDNDVSEIKIKKL